MRCDILNDNSPENGPLAFGVTFDDSAHLTRYAYVHAATAAPRFCRL
jgi:hypothetical protein